MGLYQSRYGRTGRNPCRPVEGIFLLRFSGQGCAVGKGQKGTSRRSSNNGRDNIITNGSSILRRGRRTSVC